jgi:hypothetical protein
LNALLRGKDSIQIIGQEINQTLRPWKNSDGSATRKFKTVSNALPPAQLQNHEGAATPKFKPKGCATRP